MKRFILLIIICISSLLVFSQNDTLYTYYPSGEILSVFPQKDSLFNGTCLKYYPTGSILMQTSWILGKMEGSSISYYENGNINVKSFYKNNVLIKSRTFYKNGILKSIFKKNNNKIFGKGFYENKKKSFISIQKGDEPVHCIYSLMPTGDNSAVCYLGDSKVIERNGKYYNEEGSELNIKYSLFRKEWHENGRQALKTKTKNGIGYYYEWNEQGELTVSEPE